MTVAPPSAGNTNTLLEKFDFSVRPLPPDEAAGFVWGVAPGVGGEEAGKVFAGAPRAIR